MLLNEIRRSYVGFRRCIDPTLGIKHLRGLFSLTSVQKRKVLFNCLT